MIEDYILVKEKIAKLSKHVLYNFVEGDNLFLKLFSNDDREDFYEYTLTPGLLEMTGWFHHKNIREANKTLSKLIENKNVFAIILKNENKVIGHISVSEEDDEELPDKHVVEIGFVISKKYWNHGYATEAARLIINYCFNELNIDSIIGGHLENNMQSKSVLMKIGFKPYDTYTWKFEISEKELLVYNYILNR